MVKMVNGVTSGVKSFFTKPDKQLDKIMTSKKEIVKDPEDEQF